MIDHCDPFADKARPYPVQSLQIELLIGLGWNKARRRSLHGLGHSMSISKISWHELPGPWGLYWRWRRRAASQATRNNK